MPDNHGGRVPLRLWSVDEDTCNILLTEEILHQFIPLFIYRVLYIPGGAGLLPSTVSQGMICVG